jgi:hypothetical protein
VSSAEFTPEFEFESQQNIAAVVLKLAVASIPIAALILYFGSREPARAPETVSQAAPEHPVAGQHAAPAEPEPVPAPAVAPEPEPPPSAPGSAESLTIEIAPTADCWAKLTADGTVAISRVLKAGERESRAFKEAAVLQVGDAEACAILINGRPARPLGPARRVRQVRITRDNYASFLP